MDIVDTIESHVGALTAEHLAGYLALSPKTIYSWVSQKRMPHFRLGAAVRFNPSEIVEWLREHYFQ